MAKSGAGTTIPGYQNRNGQVVVRRTDLPGNDHNQCIYVLNCSGCGHQYGANGSDIWHRKCPKCGDGRPGLNFDGDKMRLKVWLRPLVFPEVEFLDQKEPEPQSLLKFLCTPGIESDASSLTQRYRQISTTDELILVPAENRILEKLVWPLLHAKSSYMVGNYLGTVSLCGLVAEMVAILKYTISDENRKEMSDHEFQKRGQKCRATILKRLDLIDADIKTSFDAIRDKRRKFLHNLFVNDKFLKDDALLCYKNASKLVDFLLAPEDFQNGTALFNPGLLEYLRKNGVISLDTEGA